MARLQFKRAVIGILLSLAAGPFVLGQGMTWQQRMEAARKARAQGQGAEAAKLFEAAVQEAEKFGPDDVRLASSLNELALAYTAQKNYSEAGPAYQHALAIREKVLGADHLDVAKTLLDIANFYRVQNRPEDAEKAFRGALAIQEKALGPVNAQVAGTLNALAGRLRDQKRFAEAEPMFKRSLEIREKVLQPDDPDLVKSLLGFSAFYVEQGKFTEAEPLLLRSIAILDQIQAYGTGYPNAPDVLRTYAELLRKTNRAAEAEKMEARAKALRASR